MVLSRWASLASAMVWTVLTAGCGADGVGVAANVRGDDVAANQGRSGDGAGLEGSPSTPGIPCNVHTILERSCGACHGSEPKYGASTDLLSWAGLSKTDPRGSGKNVTQLLVERAKGSGAPMPPAPNPKLSNDEIAALESWVASGAPRSSDTCTSSAPAASTDVPKLDCNPDIQIRPETPFVVAPDAPLDDYVCYGFDVTHNEKHHVTALAPHPDNENVLHHILLFESDTAYSRTPQRCGYANSVRWKLVTGWAPGGQPINFPPEAGYPQKQGTTHYIMQLHYNNGKKLPNQKDATGFDMCSTTNLRPNDAGITAFGTIGRVNIPPRTPKYQVECTYTLSTDFKEMNFIFVSPHMHKFGRSASTYFLPGGKGSPQKVVDVSDFDFNSQAVYPISGKAKPGDVFKTRCGYTNPTEKAVKWGEGTDDEMCFNFVGYYPVVPDRMPLGLPLFNWSTPSLQASCTEVKN